MIYFDYNATTPLDPAVREAMLTVLSDFWGNPSSVHRVGRKARALLDDARDRAAKFLGAKPSEVIFTSGGTEANNLAIFGTVRRLKEKGKHLITSSVEHHSVLQCFDYLEKNEGFVVSKLPVDINGRVSIEDFKRLMRKETVFASVMAANNEIGTLQPVAEIGSICRQNGIIFHTDAVQWFGKEPFEGIDQFKADLVSICPHKFHGPKGVGMIYIRSPLHPDPILFGGSHEFERRAGTENLAGVMGLVEALEKFVKKPVFSSEQLIPLKKILMNRISMLPGVRMLSQMEGSLSNTVAFTVKGMDGMTLISGMDIEEICASGGAACSAGSLEPSQVILALGLPEEANSLVRFSLGRESCLSEVEQVLSWLPEFIRRGQLSNNLRMDC